jgi:hypothetical protein
LAAVTFSDIVHQGARMLTINAVGNEPGFLKVQIHQLDVGAYSDSNMDIRIY